MRRTTSTTTMRKVLKETVMMVENENDHVHLIDL